MVCTVIDVFKKNVMLFVDVKIQYLAVVTQTLVARIMLTVQH